MRNNSYRCILPIRVIFCDTAYCIQKPPIPPRVGIRIGVKSKLIYNIPLKSQKNTGFLSKSGVFYGASVLIGLWGKTSHTNIFSNFRAVNFLVFSSHSSAKLPITFCLNKGIKVPGAVEEGDQQRQNHQRSADNDADNIQF